MARGLAVDESEVDGDGDDFEAAAAGLHDHFALHVETVAAQTDAGEEAGGVEPESALRIGHVGLRRVRDAARGKTIRETAPRQHLAEEMRASADDEVRAALRLRSEELRNLAR